MFDVFIAVLIVMLVMIYFMVVTLRAVIINADRQVNKYFLNKLQSFDDEFQQKITQMEQLKEEKDHLAREVEGLRDDMLTFQTSEFYAPRPLNRSIYIPVARYIDNNFFEEYKSAKNMLKMNKPEILKNILNKVSYKGDIVTYQIAKNLLEKLNFDAVFDISTLQNAKQLEVLEEVLDNKEVKVLHKYRTYMKERLQSKFDILDFIKYIKGVMITNDPYITIRVGETDENFDHVDSFVRTEYDDNVCEGMRIIYQNKVYDYSIYKSRRKNEHIY